MKESLTTRITNLNPIRKENNFEINKENITSLYYYLALKNKKEYYIWFYQRVREVLIERIKLIYCDYDGEYFEKYSLCDLQRFFCLEERDTDISFIHYLIYIYPFINLEEETTHDE
ncbi:hypothetical protein [Tannockella kyphosi]|uniref:hypothetical protein n=1 Tax=Tannockella kyphosi TaxID=2899121 RepID=UPI0020117042|nr:hypothetical protein [Tannockella kyphosi]